MRGRRANRAAIVLACSLAACSWGGAAGDRKFVFVPADDYAISVEIVVPHEAIVGDWIPLRAARRSGPWKRVKRSEITPDTPWFGTPPPEQESEVADNLHWLTDPPGAARFDVRTGAALASHERKAMFNQPGTYRIWGRNAYPTAAESNVVTITVRPKR